jgi:hypothetical protein
MNINKQYLFLFFYGASLATREAFLKAIIHSFAIGHGVSCPQLNENKYPVIYLFIFLLPIFAAYLF